jgi:predicted GIY-YIG superfamily endonuclease
MNFLPELVEGLPMNEWKWYVYILQCDDGSYYVGRTWRIDTRWEQHISGIGGGYTSRHKPRRLAYAEEFEDFDQARRRELQIKGWSRMKKEKLISGEWGRWG